MANEVVIKTGLIVENGIYGNLTGNADTASGNKFIASGNIAAGNRVALKSDGTIEVVGKTGLYNIGNKITITEQDISLIASVYDTLNNKLIVAYSDADNSNFGTVIVGTVAGRIISFGTPVVFNSGSTTGISIAFDSTNGKIVISYVDVGTSNFGKAIVGTVSGTSISFGSAVSFQPGAIYNTSTVFDSTNGKIVITFFAGISRTTKTCGIVGTVSGTSISFGTLTEYNSDVTSTDSLDSVFDASSNTVVVVYRASLSSNYGYAIVTTVSGTSITAGTPVVFSSSTTSHVFAIFDSTINKVIVTYQSLLIRSYYASAVVGTVSGTSISFGTPTSVTCGVSSLVRACYDSNNNSFMHVYLNSSNELSLRIGTVSGTDIAFGDEQILNITAPESIWLTFDPDSDQVIASLDATSMSDYGFCRIIYPSSNVNNLLGVAEEAINDGESGIISTNGFINTQLSGLTIDSIYYVNYIGEVTASPDTLYDYKKLGKAISATNILINIIDTELDNVVEPKDEDYYVLTTDVNKTFTCNRSSEVFFNLPSVGPENIGDEFHFVKLGSGKVTINAQDNDVVENSAPGGSIYCDDAGIASVTIQLVTETQWIIKAPKGTWATTIVTTTTTTTAPVTTTTTTTP